MPGTKTLRLFCRNISDEGKRLIVSTPDLAIPSGYVDVEHSDLVFESGEQFRPGRVERQAPGRNQLVEMIETPEENVRQLTTAAKIAWKRGTVFKTLE